MTDPTPQPFWFERVMVSLRGPAATIVAIAILLGFLVAGLTYHEVGKKSPLYVASAATLLDQPLAISVANDGGVVDKLSRLRFKYAAELRSDAIIDGVVKRTGLPRGLVAGAIVSNGDVGSLLLFVGAQTKNPKQAVTIANAYASQLSSFVTAEQLTNKITPINRLSLTVVSPARFARQVSPTKKQRYVSGLGAGLAVGVAFSGIADVVRRRRR